MRKYKFDQTDIDTAIESIREQLAKCTPDTKEVNCKFSLSENLPEGVSINVYFSEDAWFKIKALVDKCDKEIGFDGIVDRDGTNFTISDIIVFPQEVTGSTVTTDDEKYMVWLAGLDDDTFNKRRFNGHSHVNMGVTPSGTDETYRSQSTKNIKDFFVFGIFNKKEDVELTIYDIENNVIYEHKDITYYIPIPDFDGWAKEMIDANVEEKKFVPAYNAGSGYYGGTYNAGTKKEDKKSGSKNPASALNDADDDYYGKSNEWWKNMYGNGGHY